MRECWVEHDRCAINCPCNEECTDGCPVVDENHACETWYCQGYVERCAAKDNSSRIQCPGMEHSDENACLDRGCCWVEYTGNQPYVPTCHIKNKEYLPPRE